MKSARLHLLPLAHHPREQAHRCVHLGKRRVAVCARCLGLYPVMLAAQALQWALDLGPMGRLDLFIALALALPGLLDWGEGIINHRSGNNARRLITGAMLGVALGRSVWLHSRLVMVVSSRRTSTWWVQGIRAVQTILLSGSLSLAAGLSYPHN